MSERVHEILKHWFIEEAKKKVYSKGKPVYKKVYSGDKQPIDVRKRKKSFTYQPDVVLVEPKGNLYFIELAFSEQWREIVGELAVAKAAEADAILFIVYGGEDGWKKEDLDDILSVVGESIDFTEWYTLVLTEDEYKDVEKAKKRLRAELDDWI